MRRRDFIKVVALSGAAWPLVARAQQSTSTIRRIGILVPESTPAAEARGLLGAFRQGLKEMGWVEGQNIAFEYRSADGKEDALPNLCRVGSIAIRRNLGGRHRSNPGCKKCHAIHSDCNGSE